MTKPQSPRGLSDGSDIDANAADRAPETSLSIAKEHKTNTTSLQKSPRQSRSARRKLQFWMRRSEKLSEQSVTSLERLSTELKFWQKFYRRNMISLPTQQMTGRRLKTEVSGLYYFFSFKCKKSSSFVTSSVKKKIAVYLVLGKFHEIVFSVNRRKFILRFCLPVPDLQQYTWVWRLALSMHQKIHRSLSRLGTMEFKSPTAKMGSQPDSNFR